MTVLRTTIDPLSPEFKSNAEAMAEKLAGLDGEIGKVKEFYFDDRHWVVRYLVASTGTWFADRQVLISPHALGAVKPGIGRTQFTHTVN